MEQRAASPREFHPCYLTEHRRVATHVLPATFPCPRYGLASDHLPFRHRPTGEERFAPQ